MKKVLSFILISYFLLISFNAFSINVFDQDRKKFFSFDEKIINGTTGTPLGGFGCGGVKFNAHAGTFAVMTAPPADAYDFTAKNSACFQRKNFFFRKSLQCRRSGSSRSYRI